MPIGRGCNRSIREQRRRSPELTGSAKVPANSVFKSLHGIRILVLNATVGAAPNSAPSML